MVWVQSWPKAEGSNSFQRKVRQTYLEPREHKALPEYGHSRFKKPHQSSIVFDELAADLAQQYQISIWFH